MANRYITRLDGATPSKNFTSDNIALGQKWWVYMEVCFSSTANQWFWSVWDRSDPAAKNAVAIRRRSGGDIAVYDWSTNDWLTPIITAPHTAGGIDRILLTVDGTAVSLFVNGVEYTGVGSDRSADGWAYESDGTATPVVWGARNGGFGSFSEHLNGFFLKGAIGIGTDPMSEADYRYHFNDNGGEGVVQDLAGDKPLIKNSMDASDVAVWNRVVSPAGWTDGVDTYNYNFALKYAGIVDSGQSNNLSRGTRESIDEVYQNAMGAQQFAYSTQSLANAVQPLDHVDETSTNMSSWLVFVNNLMASNYLPVDYEVSMIPVADGGTNILYWAGAGNAGYDNMITRINGFLALNPANYILTVRWIQGEADVSEGTSGSVYLSRINAMWNGLINDVASITSQTPLLITEIAGPAEEPQSQIDEINQALADFASQSFYIRLTNNDGLVTTDGTHYNAASQREIGQKNWDEFVLSQSAVEVTLTVSGAPDGTYDCLAYKAVSGGDEVVLYQGPVTFLSGEATIEAGVVSGDKIFTIIYTGTDKPNAIAENTVA